MLPRSLSRILVGELSSTEGSQGATSDSKETPSLLQAAETPNILQAAETSSVPSNRYLLPTHRNGFYAVEVRCFLQAIQCNSVLLHEVP